MQRICVNSQKVWFIFILCDDQFVSKVLYLQPSEKEWRKKKENKKDE